MERIWHRPGVLMIAYMILVRIAGPWPTSSAPITTAQVAHAFNPAAFGLAAFLAWRVTRGSSLARGLMVLYTADAVAAMFTTTACARATSSASGS